MIVLCAWLGGAVEATAASVVSASNVASEGVESHSCPCGMSCKGNCCCAGKKPKQKSGPKPRSAEQAEFQAGGSSCQLDSAPCGGGLPSRPSNGFVPVDPACLSTGPVLIPSIGPKLAPTSVAAASEPFLSRIDDPPEARV